MHNMRSAERSVHAEKREVYEDEEESNEAIIT